MRQILFITLILLGCNSNNSKKDLSEDESILVDNNSNFQSNSNSLFDIDKEKERTWVRRLYLLVSILFCFDSKGMDNPYMR